MARKSSLRDDITKQEKKKSKDSRRSATAESKKSRRSSAKSRQSAGAGSIDINDESSITTALPAYDPERAVRKTSSGATRRETKDSVQVSDSATKIAIAKNPRLSSVASTPFDVDVRISQESLQEAEQLLHKMSAPALLQLKRLLRGKADAVQRDLSILYENEAHLCELGTKLQEEKSNLEEDKCQLSESLAMMRDNLCKVTNFNCKIFEIRGDAVLEEAVSDQWTERADMLQKMENLIAKGIEEDAKVTKEFENCEKDWQKLMVKYMTHEQQIVTAHNRLDDLTSQIQNYQDLVKQQDSQLKELKALRKDHGEEMSNKAASIALLRERVSEELGPEYSLERVDELRTSHERFAVEFDESLEEIKALVMQVEATDEIRQHALEMALEKAQKPGRHGVDDEIWAEIVRTSIKASETGLKAKVVDLTDMVQFKEKAVAELLKENQDLRSVDEQTEATESEQLPKIPSDYWSPDD